MNAKWLAIFLLLILVWHPAQSAQFAVGGDKGGFRSIQEAINASGVGDTIVVQAGVYNENLLVEKQLTLRGVNNPIIDANGIGSPIRLNDNGITVEGFTLINSGKYEPGIDIYGSFFGPTLINNIIRGNHISNNSYGISIHQSNNNTVIENVIKNNKYGGINLEHASKNTLSRNLIAGNEKGIILSESTYNIIQNNSIQQNKEDGILLSYSHLSEAGHYGFSDRNAVFGNEIKDNKNGVMLEYSENNTIQGNRLINNSCAIYLESSKNNSIEDNIFLNNAKNLSSDNFSRRDEWADASAVTNVIYGFFYVFAIFFIFVNILILIVLGLIVGFIVRRLVNNSSLNLKKSLILGIIGSIAGYFISTNIIPSLDEFAYFAAIGFAAVLVIAANLMVGGMKVPDQK